MKLQKKHFIQLFEGVIHKHKLPPGSYERYSLFKKKIFFSHALARSYYALGDYEKCFRYMADVEIFSGSPLVINDISYGSLKALIQFRKKEYVNCWELSNSVLQIMRYI